MGTKDERKFENLHKLIELLLDQPQGLTKAEIARKLNVHRSTAGEYIEDLGAPGGMNVPVYEVSPARYAIDRDHFEVNISVDMHEALSLHLATRLLTTRTDKHNPHAASALRKLGRALEKLAPLISEHMKRSADVLDADERRRDPIFLQALETLTRAWSRRRKVRLTHEMEDGGIYDYVFSPYFIEPYAVGHTVHVIGLREPINKIRTFKVERIRTIELLEDASYEIPATFDPSAQLKDAWGIWFTDRAPETVKLHFTRQVAKRVSETVWHHAQEIIEQPDGSIIWTAQVAEWQEMLPWVRGWGAEVEVVEPNSLRQHLIHTVEQLGELYQVRPPSQRQPYQWLYAKTDRENPDNIHLLLYHLIDVGQVTLAMWNEVFPNSFRNHLAQQLSVTVERAGRFVAFIASLHDLGKASPAYQKKYSPPWLKEKLAEVGFILDDPLGYSQETNDKKTSHAYITTWALPPLLVEYCGLDAQFSRKIGQALGGHHGAWPINSVNFNFDDSAYPEWDIARRELVWELRNVFQPPPVPQPPSEDALNIFLTLFSGLTSVADWLGSRDDDQSFPLVKDVLTTREYAQRSKIQARRVLSDLGWIGWQPNQLTLDFRTMFQYLDNTRTIEPRPVQQQVIDLTADLITPSLIIIEAPTGIGKTEIAFYLADTLLQNHHGRGLYIAMPTQATSNQMFERTSEFLAQRYPKEIVNLQLAHGQAMFDDQLQEIRLHTIGDDETDGRIVAMSWFNEQSKRTLLAPFGVGTVDQTLMSILQTKHFFVRLLGLSHKVVIFDEVHAYDTYMSTLFVELLQWLRAIGTSVIMLSATLPAETRQKFVYAFTGAPPELASHYPAITVATPDKLAQTHLLELGDPKVDPPIPADEVILDIHWLEADQQIDHILSLAEKGGCIAIICNTVARSQSIFRQLLEARKDGKLDIERDHLILFHARFPPIWRKEIEDKTKRLFGKPQKNKEGNLNDSRPSKGPTIIVATQVIEQSLDLDFDAMITDLAPIDLLIQRAGRLHRHKIRNDQRHSHRRQLTIIQPEFDEQSIPHFGNDEYIYERYILLRTCRALHQLIKDGGITLPRQTIELIEAVYSTSNPFHDEDANWQTALKDAHQKMRRDRHESQQKAKKQIAGAPDDEMLLYETNLGLEEDNPVIHQTFQAKTRDIGPTLALICLHATEKQNRVLFDPLNATTAFDLTLPPDSDLTKKLLQRRINVQQWALLNHFLAEDMPPENAPSAWRKNSVLRHARVVIFQNGQYHFEDEKNLYALSLDRDYGLALEIQSKKETQ